MATKTSMWPVLGLVFIGAIGVIIAAIIVLALIPIYLRNKSEPKNYSLDPYAFYVQYATDLDADSSATGKITNIDEIAQNLGVADKIKITDADAQTSFERRRRETSGRHKRGVKLNILLRCVPLTSIICSNPSCIAQIRNQAILVMQQSAKLADVSFSIMTGGVLRRLRVALVFLGAVISRPSVGFNGEIASLAFVAVQSGPFTNASTWANGTIPYGNCSIIIPAGITVTLARPIFELRMRQCDIFGTLIVGGSNNNFRFNYPSAVTVHRGGNLLDASINKKILIPSNSLFMVYPGGSVGSSGTNLQIYTRNGNDVQSLGSTTTLPSSGPHTCGILRSGSIIAESKVLFIAVGSGSILRGSTFLGGVGPSAALCEAAGGCGLNIQSGATVQTDELDDDFNINFDVINVVSGGIFSVGKPGSSRGIKFKHMFRLICAGTFNFVGAGGSILLPAGSHWNFAAGGAFRAAIAILMQIFNGASGLVLSSTSLGFSFFGPIIYEISLNGTLLVNQTLSTPMPTVSMG